MNNSISQLLDRLQKEDKRSAKRILAYWIARNQFYRYLIERWRLPLISSVFTAAIHYLFWWKILENFPLFTWSDFFSDIQLIFIVSTLLNAGVESLRVASRKSQRKTSMGSGLLGFAVLPLLMILIQIANDLRFEDRFFGIYDLARIFLWARLPLSLYNRLLLSEQASDRRVMMRWFHWVLPPLSSLGLILIALNFTSFNPWFFPMALGVESVVGYVLQKTRIQKERRWEHFAAPRFKDILPLFSASAFRGLLSFPQVVFHLVVLYLMQKQELLQEQLLGLHAAQPLIQVIFKSPGLFWKERIDYSDNIGVRSKFNQFFIVLSGAWFLFWIQFSELHALAMISPLIWLQWYWSGAWLGVRDQKMEWQGVARLQVLLRKGFWNKSRRVRALQELSGLSISYRPLGNQLLFPDLSFDETKRLQKWGRGWIRSIHPAEKMSRSKPNGDQFDFKKLNWVLGHQPLVCSHLSDLELAQFYQWVLGAETGPGKGKFRVGSHSFAWLRDGKNLWVRSIGRKAG